MIIKTKRLDLIPLSLVQLRNLDNGKNQEVLKTLGNKLEDKDNVLFSGKWLFELRAKQLENDPTLDNWLVRIMVDRSTNQIVGDIGFHNRPNDNGMVEFGISTGPSFRRRGYAKEAIIGLCNWAIKSHQIEIIRASVLPDNLASLALISSLDLKHVGQQIDEIDGLELIYEKNVSKLAKLR